MDMSETNLVLKAENICKKYGEKTVLSSLNLEIEQGKIYGLIGRNGVGKTTLLGVLTCQNKCDFGSITLNGEEVWENQKLLSQIFLAREFSGESKGHLLSSPTVGYYLDMGKIFCPLWDSGLAKELLGVFGLKRKQKMSNLSKGERSYVSIILGFCSGAPITFLDEPVAGVDVVMRERFYEILLDIYEKSGRTFVISTHIIEEASSIFEEVIFIDNGKIMEKAVTEELISEFYAISGSEEAVNEAILDGLYGNTLKVVHSQKVGKRQVVTVRTSAEVMEKISNSEMDVDVGTLNLQKVFVALCGGERKASEGKGESE